MNWFSFHLQDFAYSFLSILFEGVPFLLLGSLISGCVEAFLPPNLLTRILPKNRTLAVLLSGLLGGVFPMCECGSVVVIRRFIAKGLPVSCAVTYMLAAPIVSPLVAISTFAAFRGQNPWEMTILRLAIGYLIAVAVGMIVQRLPLSVVLQPNVVQALPKSARELAPVASARSGLRIAATTCDDECGCEEAGLPAPKFSSKVRQVIQAATSDFLDVALFFVIGATIAAVFNTAVNQAIIAPLATSPVLATLTLMGLAGAMALCSSTDAFIAASFITFPFNAKLAFLAFGPVFDVKLFFLYALIFRRKFVIGLAVGLFIAIALICIRASVLGL
jgi:uncharacterized membrane protein YraQ (UPF0718 family)